MPAVGGAHARGLQRRHHRQHLMALHGRPPQAAVAPTIGHRSVAKLQALGRRDGRRRCRLAPPGEDVGHGAGAAGAAVERPGTGRLQPVLQHRRRNLGKLPAAAVAGGRPGPQAPGRVRQLPALEGRAIAQRAGLLRQDRHAVPRIAGDPAAPEAAGMLGGGLAVLADGRSDRHRPARRPAARRRGPRRCTGCCRSAPGKSWRPLPQWRGSRRGTLSGRAAPPRTPATCPGSPDADASWRPRCTDPSATR